MNNFNEPFDLFNDWLNQAINSPEIIEPTAMNLATIGFNNKPSSRMVLLKKFDQQGFCFFTNLTSKKGEQLQHNQNVALCFYWAALGKQVRIEGETEKVSEKEADDYFKSRRRGSQIGAWASKQSKEMANEEEFKQRIKQVEENFADKEVSRPSFWSGFRVKPAIIEFWEEGEFRIHKRTAYQKNDNSWQISRIYP